MAIRVNKAMLRDFFSSKKSAKVKLIKEELEADIKVKVLAYLEEVPYLKELATKLEKEHAQYTETLESITAVIESRLSNNSSYQCKPIDEKLSIKVNSISVMDYLADNYYVPEKANPELAKIVSNLYTIANDTLNKIEAQYNNIFNIIDTNSAQSAYKIFINNGIDLSVLVSEGNINKIDSSLI